MQLYILVQLFNTRAKIAIQGGRCDCYFFCTVTGGLLVTMSSSKPMKQEPGVPTTGLPVPGFRSHVFQLIPRI